MKRIVIILCAVLVCLVSCNEVYRYTNETFFAMNTVVNTIISSEIAQDNTREILSDIEKRMSRTSEQSEIFRLNNRDKVTLSEDTLKVLERSLQIAKDTDYAFNPCMGTLTDLWDITSGRNVVPSQDEIEIALSFCDTSLVEISDGNVKIPDGMKIDLGGVAKGYALQKAAEDLSQRAVSKFAPDDFCISLGGNVAVMGTSQSRKNSGEKGWSVGITNPFDKNETIGTVILEHGYVSVSGAYERFFEKDGIIYHHIFDGKTGYPCDSDLASAVVISDDGLEADSLSTALFVMGKNRAVEFYRQGNYKFDMILVDVDGCIYISDGIYESFAIDEEFGIPEKNLINVGKQEVEV